MMSSRQFHQNQSGTAVAMVTRVLSCRISNLKQSCVSILTPYVIACGGTVERCHQQLNLDPSVDLADNRGLSFAVKIPWFLMVSPPWRFGRLLIESGHNDVLSLNPR